MPDMMEDNIDCFKEVYIRHRKRWSTRQKGTVFVVDRISLLPPCQSMEGITGVGEIRGSRSKSVK